MGQKDRNFPKAVGTTVPGAIGGAVGVNTIITGINFVSSALSFEGGTPEMSTKDRIL